MAMKLKKDNIISSYNSPRSRKDQKINESIANYFDKQKDSILAEDEIQKNKNEILTEDIAIKMKDTKILDESKKTPLQIIKEKSDLQTTIFFESLTYIIYESLWLDDDFKSSNKKYIIENINKTLNAAVPYIKNDNTCTCIEMIKSGINNSIETFYGNPRFTVDTFSGDGDTDEIKKNFLKSVKDNCKFEFEACTGVIKDKVLNTLNNEKVLAKNLQECFNESTEIVRKKAEDTVNHTLFKTLFNKNVVSVSNELGDTAPRKDVLDLALSESILTYTILETLHTLKLVEVDPKEMIQTLKYA